MSFQAGDLVQVRAEEAVSRVVLPDDEPDLGICVPTVLIRTPYTEDGTLRRVEPRDLKLTDLKDAARS